METQRYYTSICGALLKLSNKNKLSEFDLSFVDNWLAKKVNGRYFHVGEQARNVAVLLSNRLGEICIEL